MNSKHQNQNQQCRHHHLTDSFQTILQSTTANQKACDHSQHHPESHLKRICQKVIEYLACFIRCHSMHKLPGCKLIEIGHHPAGNRCIIHHQHITSKDSHPAMNMPLTTRFLQCFISKHCTFTTGTSDRQLHRQHRKPHNNQKYQIKQYK